MRRKNYTSPSLLQLFAPPPDFVGSFGWICGYSADASFLDAAAERFTLQTQAQRAAAGKVSLAVLLDQGQAQIRPHEAHGALHLPMRDAYAFALLHAKVALLGFVGAEDSSAWCLRLLVSTGNWTRGTLEDSLDLAWAVDLHSADLGSDGKEVLRARADIAAAWNLMKWLAARFDLSALDAVPESLSGIARARFAEWCESVRRPRGIEPRFFDSRAKSLLAQLPELVREHAGAIRRNWLSMGSGFYEGTARPEVVPEALQEIVDALRGGAEPLLTASSGVEVFVEPSGCQAVATSLPAMLKQRWTVRPPGQPGFLEQRKRRTLHAKFIFSCNYVSSSNSCSSAWLYLGSGNLTRPGFLQKCPRGNLEAGVVLRQDDLFWERYTGDDPAGWVEHRLPMQWKKLFTNAESLEAGAGMPERPPAFVPPPIAWCRYVPARKGVEAHLQLPPHDGRVQVVGPDGRTCAALGENAVAWDGAPQPSVIVRWTTQDKEYQASIPVIDAAGRIGGTELQKLDLEAAWWQLHQFPMPPEEEDPGEEGRDFDGNGSAGGRSTPAAESAIRTMMRLVENLADKQGSLPEADWLAWCASMEQTLLQATGSPTLEAFVQLGINPLSPLRVPCFAPEFARDENAPARDRYLRALDAVERAWGVQGLEALGPIATGEAS